MMVGGTVPSSRQHFCSKENKTRKAKSFPRGLRSDLVSFQYSKEKGEKTSFLGRKSLNGIVWLPLKRNEEESANEEWGDIPRGFEGEKEKRPNQ